MKEKLTAFLLKAKKSTYAANGAESESSRPNSHDLIYAEDGFEYIDTYLGGEKFAGQEAVWEKGAPIWSMNYVGRVVDENFSGDFLKDALLHVTHEMPYRGPDVYEDGSYKYTCKVSGDFEWFQGSEEISFCGNKIYECHFHGGTIK